MIDIKLTEYFESTAFEEQWLVCSPQMWQIMGVTTSGVKPKTERLVFAASALTAIKSESKEG